MSSLYVPKRAGSAKWILARELAPLPTPALRRSRSSGHAKRTRHAETRAHAAILISLIHRTEVTL